MIRIKELAIWVVRVSEQTHRFISSFEMDWKVLGLERAEVAARSGGFVWQS